MSDHCQGYVATAYHKRTAASGHRMVQRARAVGGPTAHCFVQLNVRLEGPRAGPALKQPCSSQDAPYSATRHP